MNPELEYISCNICGSEKNKTIYRVESYSAVKCSQCGLVYINPRPKNPEKLYGKEYYTGSQKNSYDDYTSWRGSDKLRDKHNQLMRHAKVGKLLDVGCAMGFSMEIAQAGGWQTIGMEVGEYAAKYGREQLGLNILLAKTLKDANFKCEEFNAVTMWGVLEHFSNPLAELKEAYRVLKNDGIIGVEVPNIGGLQSKLDGQKWFQLKPIEHLYYFDPKTLENILHKAGFTVLEMNPIFFPRKASAPLIKLLTMLNINLGDKIIAFAKK